MNQISFSEVPQGLFPGTNFVTPRNLMYYKRGEFYAEYSEGDFMGHKMFGCSFETIENGERKQLYDISQPKDSKQEALTYIDETLKSLVPANK